MDKLEYICFAQFAKIYTSGKQAKYNEENNCNAGNEKEDNSGKDDPNLETDYESQIESEDKF